MTSLAAGAAGRTAGMPAWSRRLRAWLAATLLAERERWVLWLPVGLGAGIAGYFVLPAEPGWWIGPLALAVTALLAVVLWRRPPAALAMLAAATVAAGFAAAQWRAGDVAAPVLEREVRAGLAGRVVSIEPDDGGRRLVIAVERIGRLPAAALPRLVRVTTGAEPPLDAGDRIDVFAALRPPPAPAAPGAYDFQRRAWFEGIGGVGFTMGRPKLVERAAASGPALWLDDLRTTVHARIVAAVPGAAGAVASALITGLRGAIPEETVVAMRDSGLAHLLAISGLHLGLVAGLVFLVVRGGLALVPAVALRRPIKKWAAVAALIAGAAYLLLAGAPVPTQRAWLMLALVCAAVLADRAAISMRLVAWAATAILLLRPESLLGASFQMSFAAVVALVAAWEALGARFVRGGDAGPLLRLARYAGGVALTSLVAGLATTPFALYHFDRLVLYGLAANMVAVPVTAMWIMPLGIAALLLMPFGGEALTLVPMGWGIDVVRVTAAAVAGWPGAVALVPAMPVWGLGIIALGGLWLVLWTRRWRFGGIAVAAAGLATVFLTDPADVLVDGDGGLMAVRAADGGYHVSGRRDAFTRDVWLRRAGSAAWTPFPRGTSHDGRLTCDGEGCLYTAADGTVVALVSSGTALAEDCRVAAVVVATVAVRGRCPSAVAVIDRRDLWREGGHAVWLGGPLRIETVNGGRGDRPWVSPGR
ncbi:MAG: ComEC/Rec2 family competence protein [Alphaproteobacteria bacterium]